MTSKLFFSYLLALAVAAAMGLEGCGGGGDGKVDGDADGGDPVDVRPDDAAGEAEPDAADDGPPPDGTEQTTDRIEQYGIAWTFESPVPYGQFANGDYWVVGPVVITAITPAFDGEHHGWEVNPADAVLQGFDTRVADFDALRVPALPYTAGAGESIVKWKKRY